MSRRDKARHLYERMRSSTLAPASTPAWVSLDWREQAWWEQILVEAQRLNTPL